MNVKRILPAALLSLAMWGCGTVDTAAPNDGEVGKSDDAIRITPTGDEKMASLTLLLPTGACLPGNSCTRPLAKPPVLTLDGAALTLAQPLRTLPGVHTLVVNSTSMEITLQAGTNTSMTLPVIKEVCTQAPATTLATTDFGRVPSLRYANCPAAVSRDGKELGGVTATAASAWIGTGCTGTLVWSDLPRTYNCAGLTLNTYTLRSVKVGGTCYDVPAREWRAACESFAKSGPPGLGVSVLPSGVDIATLPGTYAFELETASGVTREERKVLEGEMKDFSFTLPQIGEVPPLFTTKINFQDPRALPDAQVASITSNCERNYNLPASVTSPLELKAFQFSACTYQLNAGGRTVALSQTSTNTISLHRLDMDDVVITREDGTQYTTKGKYEVYFGGQRVAGPLDTNSGIDMLPGTYEVVVSYKTADGAKTNRYNVSF